MSDTSPAICSLSIERFGIARDGAPFVVGEAHFVDMAKHRLSELATRPIVAGHADGARE